MLSELRPKAFEYATNSSQVLHHHHLQSQAKARSSKFRLKMIHFWLDLNGIFGALYEVYRQMLLLLYLRRKIEPPHFFLGRDGSMSGVSELRADRWCQVEETDRHKLNFSIYCHALRLLLRPVSGWLFSSSVTTGKFSRRNSRFNSEMNTRKPASSHSQSMAKFNWSPC